MWIFDGFNRPDNGMIDVDHVILYFVECHGLFNNPASLQNGPSNGSY